MRLTDWGWLILLLALFLVSGEREKDLRLRLEAEESFSRALAWEAEQVTNALSERSTHVGTIDIERQPRAGP